MRNVLKRISFFFFLPRVIDPITRRRTREHSESMKMEKSLAPNDYFHYFIFEVETGLNASISRYG